MQRFFYQAYSRHKEKKEGVIEAENKTQALTKLDKLSLFPINIKSLDEDTEGTIISKVRGRINSSDIVSFTRQISNLLDAGITILAALILISKQVWKPSLKSVIAKLIDDLKEGKTFSNSLSGHANVFSGLYIALIKSAEAGGFLKEVMARLANFMEEEEELKSKIRSAMIYPILIALVGILTVYVLLSFVIPKIVMVFQDFEQMLPLPTQILISISSFVSYYWWLIVLSIVLIIFILNRILKTKEGRSFFDRFKLGVPILGSLILKTQMERFSRILATLLGNGVTILPSLEIVRDVIENRTLKDAIGKICLDVRDGSTLSKAVSKSRYFPASIINIISVGEESGSLDKVLKNVSNIYAREVDRSLKIFISLLEPAMILIMGSIVAFIVIAMLLPIFQINFMAG